MAPLSSSEALNLVTIAGPYGSQACSCSRIHCTRDQSRIRGGIVGAVMAVTPGALDMNAANALERHPQHFRDRLTIGIDALGMGPDRERAIDQLRDCAGRPDRAMRLVGPRIAGLDGFLAGSCGIALLEDDLVLRRQAGQHARQIVLL